MTTIPKAIKNMQGHNPARRIVTRQSGQTHCQQVFLSEEISVVWSCILYFHCGDLLIDLFRESAISLSLPEVHFQCHPHHPAFSWHSNGLWGLRHRILGLYYSSILHLLSHCHRLVHLQLSITVKVNLAPGILLSFSPSYPVPEAHILCPQRSV